MSYRNPQIIVDRTAEAYAQASTNLGKTMVKGVEDIYRAQEVEAARIKKENEGYQLVQNNVMLNYNEQQQKAVAGIKNKGLSGQFVNMYEGMLEGKNGAIAAKTALKINGASLPKEERRRLLKIVNDAESFKNVMVNGAGVVIADVEDNSKIKPGDIGNGYNWRGQGKEKFGNMLAYQAIADQTITGVTQEKTLDRLDDGTVMMKVNSTIDTNSEAVKGMIEKGLVSLDDLEVDDKGFAKLPTWEMDIAKYGDGMVIKTPENIDQAKSLEQAGFVKNGIANKETIGASNVTVEFGKGTKNQSTVSYFDPTNIEGSKALQDMYKDFASGNILSRPLDEQLNYLSDTLKDPYTQKDWANKTPAEQTKIIADRLMEQGVEAVQGSGFKKRKATKDDIEILEKQGIELKGDYVYTKTDKSARSYTSEKEPAELTYAQRKDLITRNEKSKADIKDIGFVAAEFRNNPQDLYINQKLGGKKISQVDYNESNDEITFKVDTGKIIKDEMQTDGTTFKLSNKASLNNLAKQLYPKSLKKQELFKSGIKSNSPLRKGIAQWKEENPNLGPMELSKAEYELKALQAVSPPNFTNSSTF